MQVLDSETLDLTYQFVGYTTPNSSILPFPWTLAVFVPLRPHGAITTLEEWADETREAAETHAITFMVQRLGRFEPTGENYVEEGYAALNPFWTFKELHYLPLSHAEMPFHYAIGPERRHSDAPSPWERLGREWKCKGILSRAIPWTLSSRWSVFTGDATGAAIDLLSRAGSIELGVLGVVKTYAMHFLLQLESTAHFLGHFALNEARAANYEMSSSRLDLPRLERFARTIFALPQMAILAEMVPTVRPAVVLAQLMLAVAQSWHADQVDGIGQFYAWPTRYHFATLSGSTDPAGFPNAYLRQVEAAQWAIEAQEAIVDARGAGNWADLSDSKLGEMNQEPFGIFLADGFVAAAPRPPETFVPNELAWQCATRVHTPLLARMAGPPRADRPPVVLPNWDTQILVQNFLLSHPFLRYQLANGNRNTGPVYDRGTPALIWLAKICPRMEYLLAPSVLGSGSSILQERLICLMKHGVDKRRFRDDSSADASIAVSLLPRYQHRMKAQWRKLVDQTLQPWSIWEPIEAAAELENSLGYLMDRAYRIPAIGLLPFAKEADAEGTLWLQYEPESWDNLPRLSGSLVNVRSVEEARLLAERHLATRETGGDGMFALMGRVNRTRRAFVVFHFQETWTQPLQANTALRPLVELARTCPTATPLLVTDPFQYGPQAIPMREVAKVMPWLPLRETSDPYWTARFAKESSLSHENAVIHTRWWPVWFHRVDSFASPLLSQIKNVHATARARVPEFEADINDARLLVLLRALLHLPNRLETRSLEDMNLAKEAAPGLQEEVYLFPGRMEIMGGYIRDEAAAKKRLEQKKGLLVKVWVSMEDVRSEPAQFWSFFHSPSRCWAECKVDRVVLTFCGPVVDDVSAHCARIWMVDTFMQYFCNQYSES